MLSAEFQTRYCQRLASQPIKASGSQLLQTGHRHADSQLCIPSANMLQGYCMCRQIIHRLLLAGKCIPMEAVRPLVRSTSTGASGLWHSNAFWALITPQLAKLPKVMWAQGSPTCKPAPVQCEKAEHGLNGPSCRCTKCLSQQAACAGLPPTLSLCIAWACDPAVMLFRTESCVPGLD